VPPYLQLPFPYFLVRSIVTDLVNTLKCEQVWPSNVSTCPHAVGRTGRVEVFAQHQTAGLLLPQPLLELQGAQRRDGLEVVVQTRDAHSHLACEALDAKWLVTNSVGMGRAITSEPRDKLGARISSAYR